MDAEPKGLNAVSELHLLSEMMRLYVLPGPGENPPQKTQIKAHVTTRLQRTVCESLCSTELVYLNYIMKSKVWRCNHNLSVSLMWDLSF